MRERGREREREKEREKGREREREREKQWEALERDWKFVSGIKHIHLCV